MIFPGRESEARVVTSGTGVRPYRHERSRKTCIHLVATREKAQNKLQKNTMVSDRQRELVHDRFLAYRPTGSCSILRISLVAGARGIHSPTAGVGLGMQVEDQHDKSNMSR